MSVSDIHNVHNQIVNSVSGAGGQSAGPGWQLYRDTQRLAVTQG